ncbi:MAG: stage II sporulation protein M, partial [Chloroflexota bacterium]|nr:stage II sporulation protein M [Chloroflexota bacterium]
TAAQGGVDPWRFLLAFVLPHGILEIPAIIIAGAIILRLGVTLVTPVPGRTIREAWLQSFAEWARILIFVVIPLLFFAAILEIYITPHLAFWLFH